GGRGGGGAAAPLVGRPAAGARPRRWSRAARARDRPSAGAAHGGERDPVHGGAVTGRWPLIVLSALVAGRTGFAACNAVPGAAIAFRGTLGMVDRPFARPGAAVKVELGPTCHAASPAFCPGGPCGASPEDDVVVTVVFAPPAGPRNIVVLSTDCAAVGTARREGPD